MSAPVTVGKLVLGRIFKVISPHRRQAIDRTRGPAASAAGVPDACVRRARTMRSSRGGGGMPVRLREVTTGRSPAAQAMRTRGLRPYSNRPAHGDRDNRVGASLLHRRGDGPQALILDQVFPVFPGQYAPDRSCKLLEDATQAGSLQAVLSAVAESLDRPLPHES